MKKLYNVMPLLAGILWGTSGPFVRHLTAQHWNNMTVLFSRMVMASALLFLFILVTDRSLFKIKLRDIWIFIMNGAVFTLGLNICYQESINRLTLSLAAVLLGLSPVFVLILARILFKEKITAVKVFSMFLALFGCVLVSGVLEQSQSGNVTFISILIGLLSALCYAMQSIMARLASDKGYSAVTTTFYTLTSLFIITLPFADKAAIGSFVSYSPVSNILFLIAQALCASVLPSLLYNACLSKVETGRASILAAAGEPSAATVFGMLIYHEMPSLLSVTGLVIVIIALSILCHPEKNPAAKD